MKASLWGCYKGVSSSSDLSFPWSLNDLLDDKTSLVGFCLVPESYDSSNDVSDEPSEDNED